MAILQPIIDLAAICYGHGVRHVVVSPGSRSAALTLAFARHGGFEMHICMDERPAGFIALGMAQQIGLPVVLICTSGSAAYNFAPAVAEAFFQHIPLLVLTADRPKEWLHQLDGQTIYQTDIYGKHVKAGFELAADYQHPDVHWAINRTVNEALLLSMHAPFGPVHINVPIREPFYPSADEIFQPSEKVRIIKSTPTITDLPVSVWHELIGELEDSRRMLIAVGQGTWDSSTIEVLEKISDEWQIPVLGDCISNLHSDKFIAHHDLFLGGEVGENLQPDLLITFGLSFLSKEFKQFIRKNRPKQHWHVGVSQKIADPTQSVTQSIQLDPQTFIKNIYERIDYQLFTENRDLEIDTGYHANWNGQESIAIQKSTSFLLNLFSLNDLTLIENVFKLLEGRYQLHLANSMSVRYANVLRLNASSAEVFANRGTSGIDGCVSTAIGAAKVNEKPILLLVGDVAFLYDRNGLLTKDLPQNLKIVVINNAGGNIFRMIDGPAKQPELEAFFETRHNFNAKRTCEDSGIAYFEVREAGQMHQTISKFLAYPGICLLEAFTNPEENTRVWKQLKGLMK